MENLNELFGQPKKLKQIQVEGRDTRWEAGQKQVETVDKDSNERKYILDVKLTVFRNLMKYGSKSWRPINNSGVLRIDSRQWHH